MLEFSPVNETVASQRLPAVGGEVLTVVGAHGSDDL